MVYYNHILDRKIIISNKNLNPKLKNLLNSIICKEKDKNLNIHLALIFCFEPIDDIL